LDYLEATPIKYKEKVQRVTQNVEFWELTTEWHVRYTISPRWVSEQVKFVRFVTEQDFIIEEMQPKDSYCGRIIKVLETHQPEKEYKSLEKRFVIINKILYKKPDSKYYNPRLVMTEQMLKRALMEYHDSPEAGHFGIDKTCKSSRKVMDQEFVGKSQRIL